MAITPDDLQDILNAGIDALGTREECKAWCGNCEAVTQCYWSDLANVRELVCVDCAWVIVTLHGKASKSVGFG